MPTAPEGFEKVPSWKVTAEMLRCWGFPVKEVGQVCGSKTVLVEGDDHNEALRKAIRAGFAVLRSTPDSERTWTVPKERGFDAEVGAWFMRIKRVEV